jgi:hypothetical protein
LIYRMMERVLGVLLFGVLLAPCGSCMLAAEQKASTSLSPCVQDLKIPKFGPGARAAGDSAQPVISIVEIGANGSPAKIEFRNGDQRHRHEIEWYLRDSSFSSACAGKRIEIRFSFRIEGPRANYHTLRIEFKPPNHFLIFTNPLRPTVD